MKYLHLRTRIFLSLLRYRLSRAVLTRPSWQDWVWASQLLLGYAAVVIPLGLSSGLIQLAPANLTLTASILLAVRVMLFPAMLEEIFWRATLLPYKTERVSDRKRWFAGISSLCCFVLMHPLNSMTFYTTAFSTFTNPVFLVSTTLLGLICMLTYWRSGSLWVPATCHWLIVFVWLMFCGGYERLYA